MYTVYTLYILYTFHALFIFAWKKTSQTNFFCLLLKRSNLQRGNTKMSTLTVDDVSESLLHNLIRNLVQDIVSQETVRNQRLLKQYPNYNPYVYDSSGQKDVNGQVKQQESSQYFSCQNCNREISANRFAAHLERCLNRNRR